jgi:hypothetical protein
MMQKYNDIPPCPDSLDTLEAREAWMDCCEDLIERDFLNDTTIEALKSYVFALMISRELERMMTKNPANIQLNLLWFKCTNRMIEASEILGFTPKDRGLL